MEILRPAYRSASELGRKDTAQRYLKRMLEVSNQLDIPLQEDDELVVKALENLEIA